MNNALKYKLMKLHPDAGADPGFDQGGPQIVTGLKLPFWGLSFGAGASFLVVRGGPPWIRPCDVSIKHRVLVKGMTTMVERRHT